MIFIATDLPGAMIVDLDRKEDSRGFFARSWCHDEFVAHGLNPALVQCNVSFNKTAGTLRGMHLQIAPHEEAKLVRCTAGAIYDVIIDLRPDSRTYTRHLAVELSAENRRALYVPEGFAHGFITLADNTEIFYQMSAFYAADSQRGYRHNDSAFGIRWPVPITVMSEKDTAYPDFVPVRR
jgi:dTDP-4-dehydrorhamnose 3,5-epimerase